VNRGTSGAWTVNARGGEPVELPVNGWLAIHSAAGFYEFSANQGGRRIDYVSASEFEFLDGRGAWTEHGNLGATGSLAMRRKGSHTLELIDIYGTIVWRFDPPRGNAPGVRCARRQPRSGRSQFSPFRLARIQTGPGRAHLPLHQPGLKRSACPKRH